MWNLNLFLFHEGFACIFYTIGYHEVKGPMHSRVSSSGNKQKYE